MSNIKISELPQATNVGTSDIVPIVQGGTTKQASISQATENKANHNNVAKDFWYGTQAEYEALATKDSTTIYMTDEDTTTPIATTINESSTNSEIAGAKAVADITKVDMLLSKVTGNPRITVTGSYVYLKVPFDTIVSQINNNLTLDNNYIVVGDNVSLVEITISLSFVPISNQYVFFNIMRTRDGANEIIAGSYDKYTDSNYKTVALTTFVDVQAGDKIWLATGSGASSGTIEINSNARLGIKSVNGSNIGTATVD